MQDISNNDDNDGDEENSQANKSLVASFVKNNGAFQQTILSRRHKSIAPPGENQQQEVN